MNGQQIVMCAEAIIQEKWMFKLDDVDLCLRNALMGQYGDFFNRVDMPTIFGFIRKYEQERDHLIAKNRDTDMQNNNIYDIFKAPQMKQILDDVTDKLAHKEAAPADNIERKLSPFEKMVQDEWDAMVKSEYVALKAYKNQLIDFTAFRATRAEEEVLKHGPHDTNEIPPLS